MITGHGSPLAGAGEGSAVPPTSEPSRPSCLCDPDSGVYCDDASKLWKLVERGERLRYQYGDVGPLRLAVSELAEHLRIDRASAVLRPFGEVRRGPVGARSMRRIP